MTDRELMQQALDVIELPITFGEIKMKKTIAALRERLAQPEQYPVAWKQAILATTDQCAALIQERDELQQQVWRYEKHGVTCQTYRHKVEQSCSECNVRERYAPTPPPRQWQGLTSEDKVEILRANGEAAVLILTEAKLREKNT